MNEQNISLMAFTNGILDLHYSNLFLKRQNGKQISDWRNEPVIDFKWLQMAYKWTCCFFPLCSVLCQTRHGLFMFLQAKIDYQRTTDHAQK